MVFGHCIHCEKPIYFGPRIKTNLPITDEVIWRHVDIEHHKCAGFVPKAWPIEVELQNVVSDRAKASLKRHEDLLKKFRVDVKEEA